jgi:hypothetical protein
VQAWPRTGGIAGLEVVARLRFPAPAALASLAAAVGLLGLPGLLRTAGPVMSAMKCQPCNLQP